MPGVNKVLYNLDQRGETTPEERTVARRNIDAISQDEVALIFDDHYKVKQSPINMTFASNAVLRRLYQNANGEIGAECNYIYNATQETAGFMSPQDKTKLDGIAYGAEVNVQSDWNVTDDSLDSFIRNKPDLSIFATRTELDGRLQGKQDVLTAGRNITIENNVISATAEPQQNADWEATSGVTEILNKPQNLVQDPDYVHTDNNFTDADKTKLSGIEAGAEVNVKPDWDAVAGSDAEILNKPQNLVQDADYHHTDNNYTTAEKNKLAGIEAGAEVNVNADWNAAAGTDSEILNKPDLSVYATKTEVASDLADKQDKLTAGSNITITNNVISATAEPQQNADWNATSGVTEILNKPQNLVQDASYVHTDNNFTTAEKNKLAGIEAGSEVNVQADWTENDSSKDSYVRNRPTSKPLVAGTNISIVESAAQVTISASAAPQVNADWDATSGVSAILNKPDLSVYATKSEVTTGLAGKQDTLTAGSNISIVGNTISATAAPQQNADWNATSGVTAILNKPDIPLLKWEQTTQGGTNTFTSDHLTIHQDTHEVRMENAAHTGDVELGFVVPPVSSAPTENMVLGMASGNTVPTWGPAPSVPPLKDLVAGTGIIITPSATEVEIATDPNIVKDYVAGSRISIAPGANNTTVISNTMHEATFSNVFYLDTLANSSYLTMYPGGKWRLYLKQLPIYGFANGGTDNKVFLGIRYLDNSDIPSPYGTYRFGRFYPYWDGEPDQTMSPWMVSWIYDGHDPYNNGDGFNYSFLDPRDTQRLRPQKQEGYEWEVDTGISGAWIKVRSKIWWNNSNNDTPGNSLYVHVYGTVCYPYT